MVIKEQNRRTFAALFLTLLLHSIVIVLAILITMGNRLKDNGKVITIELSGMPGGNGGSLEPIMEMMPVIMRNTPDRTAKQESNKDNEKSILGANEEIVGDSASRDSSAVEDNNIASYGMGDTLFGGYLGGTGGDGNYYPNTQPPKFNNQNANGAFMLWFKLNFIRPAALRSNQIKGKILVQFVINFEGKVTDIKIIDGLTPAVDSAVIKTITRSPLWTPGKQAGYPVNVKCQMPITIL